MFWKCQQSVDDDSGVERRFAMSRQSWRCSTCQVLLSMLTMPCCSNVYECHMVVVIPSLPGLHHIWITVPSRGTSTYKKVDWIYSTTWSTMVRFWDQSSVLTVCCWLVAARRAKASVSSTWICRQQSRHPSLRSCYLSDSDALQQCLSVCVDDMSQWTASWSDRLHLCPSQTEVLCTPSAADSNWFSAYWWHIDVSCCCHCLVDLDVCCCRCWPWRFCGRWCLRHCHCRSVLCSCPAETQYNDVQCRVIPWWHWHVRWCCSSVLVGVSATLPRRPHSVLNTVAQLEFSATSLAHIMPLLCRLCWFKLLEWILFHLCVLIGWQCATVPCWNTSSDIDIVFVPALHPCVLFRQYVRSVCTTEHFQWLLRESGMHCWHWSERNHRAWHFDELWRCFWLKHPSMADTSDFMRHICAEFEY